MSRKEPNPYFSLHHGDKILESHIIFEAPHTMNAVRILEGDGKIVGQLTLPNPETGQSDVLLSMPKKVIERRNEVEIRLEAVRAELKSLE